MLHLKNKKYMLPLFIFNFILVSKTNECLDLSLQNVQCEELSIYYNLNEEGQNIAQLDYRKQTIINTATSKTVSERKEYIFYPNSGLVKRKIYLYKRGVRFFYEYEQIKTGGDKMQLIQSKSFRPNDWDIKNILYS